MFCLCIMGLSGMAFAATSSCSHPDSATGHSVVSNWTTYHYVPTGEYINGEAITVRCTVYHEVVRTTSYCTSCGYVFGYSDQENKTHSVSHSPSYN